MEKSLSEQKCSSKALKASQNKESSFSENQEKADAKKLLPPGKGLARNKTEATGYIAEMLPVLCGMAKDVDLKFLNYLLEMAYEETIYRGNDEPEPGRS